MGPAAGQAVGDLPGPAVRGSNGAPASAPVDAAIAAIETRPAYQVAKGSLTMSSGRSVRIAFPADMTEAEMVDFIGWLTTRVRGEVAAHAPGVRLLIPQ